MARDGSFIRQFIADFWDLLPKKDIDLLGAYWHGITMVMADLYARAFDTTLGTTVEDVQVFPTRRWNKFELTSSTADLSEKTDSIVLAGTTPVAFSEDAILFDTMTVSATSGQSFHSENLSLVDEAVLDLEYGDIIEGTVRVSSGGAIFIEGRDYRLNRGFGKISRVDLGGIPSGTNVLVSYSHLYYKDGVDVVIDKTLRTIARIASGNVADGETVQVSYTYDNSTPDALSGKGSTSSITGGLTDGAADFSGVLQGRTLTISSGPNVGSYEILSVVSSIEVKISGAFPSDDPVSVYAINAFPYAISVDNDIVSVPTMQDRITDPTLLIRENVDYIIGNGKISFRSVPPYSIKGEIPTWWAEETFIDLETVYRNFGVLIDFYRESSEDYLKAVKGLWYTYWMGSTNENIKRGLQILLGLPFASENGEVESVTQEDVFDLDVSVNADITPEPVRDMPTDLTDSITSPSTISFPSAAGSFAFSTSDIGKKIRIRSSASNNGYYTILTIVSGQTVTVSETTLVNESSGFTGTIYEASPIDRFSYDHNTFTIDDIDKIIRVSGSMVNDADYVIEEIVSQNSVRVALDAQGDGFQSVDGPGGFTAEIHHLVDSVVTISDEEGVLTSFTVPSGLEAIVSKGDTIEKFQRLTNGVDIVDFASEENFVEDRLGRSGIQRFLTQNASHGVGNSDETKALTLLKNHLWIPQVLTAAASESTNAKEIIAFLENMKPEWSEYVFSFSDAFSEQLNIGETLLPEDISLQIDLTTRLINSWRNTSPGQTQYQSTSGTVSMHTLRSPSAGLDILAPSRFKATDGAFSASDVGRSILISGSASGNDGLRVISRVLSSTEVLVDSSSDFASNEAGGFTASVQALVKMTDASASFLSDAEPGDVVTVLSAGNFGEYRIREVVDANNIIIDETALDGPFLLVGSTSFEIVSSPWFQDRDSSNMLEGFIHERADGAVTGASTFSVDPSVDLQALGVIPGFMVVVKSGANMDFYEIASVLSKTEVTISGTFPTHPNSPEDYAICQVALMRENASSVVLEALPI